jgi:hypothetical protein
MHDEPEYSVSCTYATGRTAGRCFDRFDEADTYYRDCVASGRYTNVQMWDAVDNLLDEWMPDDCEDDDTQPTAEAWRLSEGRACGWGRE